MRALYIISIVLSFFFLIIMAAGTIGTKEEKDRYYDHLLYSADSDYGDVFDDNYYYENKYKESTIIAVTISMVFFVWAYILFILSAFLIKTTTSRVLSIIALSLTLLMTIWGVMVLDSPRSMSFDEVGPAWILYALAILIFSIIGTVQAFRYHRKQNPAPAFAGQFQQPYNPYPQNPFLQNQYPQNQYQQPYQQPYQQQPYQQYPQQPYGNPYNPNMPQNPVAPPQQPVNPANPFAPQNPAPPQNQQNPFAPQNPVPPVNNPDPFAPKNPAPPQNPQNPFAPQNPVPPVNNPDPFAQQNNIPPVNPVNTDPPAPPQNPWAPPSPPSPPPTPPA